MSTMLLPENLVPCVYVPVYTSWDEYWCSVKTKSIPQEKDQEEQHQQSQLADESMQSSTMDGTSSNNSNDNDEFSNENNHKQLSLSRKKSSCSKRRRRQLLVLNVVVNNCDQNDIVERTTNPTNTNAVNTSLKILGGNISVNDYDEYDNNGKHSDDDESHCKKKELDHANDCVHNNPTATQTPAASIFESGVNDYIDFVIVSIPFNDLESRRFELPPRNKPLIVCTSTSNDVCWLQQMIWMKNKNYNRYAATNVDTSFVFDKIQRLLLGGSTITNTTMNNDTCTGIRTHGVHNMSPNTIVETPTPTSSLSTTTKPWNITCFILFHSQTHVSGNQMNTGHCRHRSISTRVLAPQPQPRLWKPDPMISNTLLPTLLVILEKVQEESQEIFQQGNAYTMSETEPSSSSSSLRPTITTIKEIWDLGSGIGRDVCYLAEELKIKLQTTKQTPSSLSSSPPLIKTTMPAMKSVLVSKKYNFCVVGYDQRYRPNSTAVQETVHFWKRREVYPDVTDCRLWQFHTASRSSCSNSSNHKTTIAGNIVRNSSSRKCSSNRSSPILATCNTRKNRTATATTGPVAKSELVLSAAEVLATDVTSSTTSKTPLSSSTSSSSPASDTLLVTAKTNIDTIPQFIERLRHGNVICIYAVRFWNRSLFCAIVDASILLPDQFLEKNVLERNELHDMFTGAKDYNDNKNRGSWTILLDRIVYENHDDDDASSTCCKNYKDHDSRNPSNDESEQLRWSKGNTNCDDHHEIVPNRENESQRQPQLGNNGECHASNRTLIQFVAQWNYHRIKLSSPDAEG